MFEKVNPAHPDKIADRIAGALVDYCYGLNRTPKCAYEVLIGHGECFIVGEGSEFIPSDIIAETVYRIAGEDIAIHTNIVAQDDNLAANQSRGSRCGDNGIFKGVPTSTEERELSAFAKGLYEFYPFDGKHTIGRNGWTVCQSHMNTEQADAVVDYMAEMRRSCIVNPIGEWDGGTDVDTGATNRKLGSDMGRAITGGGLHGKDLSKADVTLNVLAHMRAQVYDTEVEAICAIGDEYVTLTGPTGYHEEISFPAACHEVRTYIEQLGGFEKFAEWGLI